MEAVEFQRMTGSLRRQLEGDERDPFGTDALGVVWREKSIYFGTCDDDQLVAAAGLLTATIVIDDEGCYPVVGFGDLIVKREYRGRGLAAELVHRSIRHAERMGPDLAMLFCGPRLVPFYERFAFREIGANVLVDQSDGVVQIPAHSMWRPLHRGAEWPIGQVHLRGLPF